MNPSQRNVEVSVKIVGHRKTPTDMLSEKHDSTVSVKEWRRALPTPFIPRGVYCFRTHEEAEEWFARMITRRRPTTER